MSSVDFLVSSASFLLFCPLHPVSNFERLLVLWLLAKKKCCIYFLIYACVTIQRFGAALLAVSSWIISWYPLGLFCVMSDIKNVFNGHMSTLF